jgi:hypothetical protein
LPSTANNGLSNNQPSGSLWSDNYSPPLSGQTGGGFASDRPGINPTPVSNTVSNGGTLTDSAPTDWGGRQFSNQAIQDANTPSVAQRADSSVVIDRLLMLILGGATCFTWIAYMDVRNKYLSVLRAAPGSGYSNAA